jgi:hypothetical protein
VLNRPVLAYGIVRKLAEIMSGNVGSAKSAMTLSFRTIRRTIALLQAI